MGVIRCFFSRALVALAWLFDFFTGRVMTRGRCTAARRARSYNGLRHPIFFRALK